jgi:formyltetrahydrofolate synthetase
VAESGESKFKVLYDLDLTIEQKVEIIAKEIYRAKIASAYSGRCADRLAPHQEPGPGEVARVHRQDAVQLQRRPHAARRTDFEITVNDIEIAAGAGFVVPILGKHDAHARPARSARQRRHGHRCQRRGDGVELRG